MKTALLLISLCLIVGSPVWASNIVLNGGFEAGNFSNWTQGGNTGYTFVTSGPFYVYSGAEQGTYYAALGPVGSDGTLSQTLPSAAGTAYYFSFWLNAVADSPSDFTAYWNGNPLTSLTNPNVGSKWTKFSFTVLGNGNDTISFAFRDDPAYIGLDDISVMQTVPEPATIGLLAAGLIGIAIGRHRRA